MADTEEKQEVESEKKSGKPWLGLVVCAAVGFFSGGLGFLTMMMLMPSPSPEAVEEVAPEMEKIFLPFGTISCNVGDGQLNRFLKITMTLQFECPKDEVATKTTELQELLDFNKPILTSWLLSYLADLKMDDIRGAAGQNRLRREIRNHFSSVLFPEADQQVQDIFFEEFIVQ